MDNTHENIVTCCVSCLLVMSDLRGSDCLSVEECTSVFANYNLWERRLVETAAVRERDIVEKVAFIVDKHFPSSGVPRTLKGVYSVHFCACLV